MIDVFISYARTDRALAQELGETLAARGYNVWWDWNLVGGDNFRSIIHSNLDTAKRVVVLWTEDSVDSGFVIDEANLAKRQNKLVPVAIRGVRPPLGFGDLHTIFSESLRAAIPSILAAISDEPLPQLHSRRTPNHRWSWLPSLVKAAGSAAIVGAFATVFSNQRLMEQIRMFVPATTAPFRPVPLPRPRYDVCESQKLGLRFYYPPDHLSLDTMQMDAGRFVFLNRNAMEEVWIARTQLAADIDIKARREVDVARVEGLGYRITYIGPEKDRALEDWYAITGYTKDAQIFYFRRWLVGNVQVSIDFIYSSDKKELYNDIIPAMSKSIALSRPLVWKANSPDPNCAEATTPPPAK